MMKNASYPSFSFFRKILVTILAWVPFFGYTQTANSLSVGIHGGWSQIAGDVSATPGYGGGVSLERSLNDRVSLRLGYTGSLNYGMDTRLRTGFGINENDVLRSPDPWSTSYAANNKHFIANFRCAVHQFSFNGVYNFYDYKLPEVNNKFYLYGTLGYSFLVADVDVNSLNAAYQPYDFEAMGIDFSEKKSAIIKKLRQNLDKTYESNAYYKNRINNDSKHVQIYHGINIGGGIKYIISNRLAVTGEFTTTGAFTDYLDGINANTSRDYINAFGIKFSYKIKSYARQTQKRKAIVEGVRIFRTRSYVLNTEFKVADASIIGETKIKGSDTSYFLKLSFVPTVPGYVNGQHMLTLRLANNLLILLPYAEKPTPLKPNERFEFIAGLSLEALKTLSISPVTNFRIDNSSSVLEDKIVLNDQLIIATVCKQLLQLRK